MQIISPTVYPCDSIRAGNGAKSYMGVVVESEKPSELEAEIKKVRANLEEFKAKHPLPEGEDVFLAQSKSGTYFIIYETPGSDAPRFAARPNKGSAALGVAKTASMDYFSADEGLCTAIAIAKHLFGVKQDTKNPMQDPVHVIEALNSILEERTGQPVVTNFSAYIKQLPNEPQRFAERLGVDRVVGGWIDRSERISDNPMLGK